MLPRHDDQLLGEDREAGGCRCSRTTPTIALRMWPDRAEGLVDARRAHVPGRRVAALG